MLINGEKLLKALRESGPDPVIDQIIMGIENGSYSFAEKVLIQPSPTVEPFEKCPACKHKKHMGMCGATVSEKPLGAKEIRMCRCSVLMTVNAPIAETVESSDLRQPSAYKEVPTVSTNNGLTLEDIAPMSARALKEVFEVLVPTVEPWPKCQFTLPDMEQTPEPSEPKGEGPYKSDKAGWAIGPGLPEQGLSEYHTPLGPSYMNLAFAQGRKPLEELKKWLIEMKEAIPKDLIMDVDTAQMAAFEEVERQIAELEKE